MDAAALIRDHRAAVYRYCRTLAGDDQAAEDALQETFLAAVQALDGFRGESSPRTWLLTIARRMVWRGARKRAGEPDHHETLDSLGVRAGWGEDSPESLAEQREQREVLERALGRLKDEDREILTLRDLEGLNVRETARVLESQESTVRARHHRARLRLMAAVREEVCDG